MCRSHHKEANINKTMIWWFIFLFCLGLSNCSEINQTDDKLMFVQIVFRHGDRTIRKAFLNDPYKDAVHWPDGYGHLTILGKRHEYELGQFFRRRYGRFIGAYSPRKVFVQSSDLDRTINSANLALAGLFPPEGVQIWNQHLLWQSIAVHTIPRDADYKIHAEDGCPYYTKILREYDNSTEIRALIHANQDLFKYVEEHAGEQILTLEDIKDIYENLNLEYRMNKTLPEWAKKIMIPGGKFEYLANYWIKSISGTTEMKKLKSGFILKDIFDRFKNKTLAKLPGQLMHIYSGHDITIASVLNGLGLLEIHTPPYSSSLLFELYKSSDSHYIQLFYRNSTTDDLAPMNIPNCGTKCSLNKLYELYREIMPSDYKTECFK